LLFPKDLTKHWIEEREGRPGGGASTQGEKLLLQKGSASSSTASGWHSQIELGEKIARRGMGVRLWEKEA